MLGVMIMCSRVTNMELAFKVQSYKYLRDLLWHLAEKGYSWIDDDSLCDVLFTQWLWNGFAEKTAMLLVLTTDGVYYDDAIHEDSYSQVLCFDTIEELEYSQYIVPNLKSTVLKNVKREYVIDVPDTLYLDGYTEPPTLTRNGNNYLLENGILYGDNHLFTKEEAEKALKDLNVNWKIKKVR